jgi:hypothetical protein
MSFLSAIFRSQILRRPIIKSFLDIHWLLQVCVELYGVPHKFKAIGDT